MYEPEPEPEPEPESAAAEGIVAIAQYEYVLIVSFRFCTLIALRHISYDASEDNELSFREGDRIIEIEAASDDWWQGKDMHGNVGLFPGAIRADCWTESELTSLLFAANYVEVQQ